MKKYFCLKLKQDPNFYYETEDTDPHQRELQLQFRLFIDNQFFHKIKITDTSLDQHKDLLKKRSYKEYQFLLFQAEQQSQIEPNTLSFTRVEIIHNRGSLWHGRIYDAPNDGYSLITSLALKNYLKDNELGDYQWKAFFGFSQEPKLAGKRNFFSLAQRKQIFQNRELGEILTRNEKTKD
ncbi:5381_t:CDS:2, partial [Racocetra persica]